MKFITAASLMAAIVCSTWRPAYAQETEVESTESSASETAPGEESEGSEPEESPEREEQGDSTEATSEAEASNGSEGGQTSEEAETSDREEEPADELDEEPSPPPATAMPDAPEPPSALPDATPTEESETEDELSLSEWEQDDWTLLQPELSLVELNGYFRVRSQFFRRLNFGNGNLGAENPTRFEVNEEIGGEREDVNLNGTDMRLRLEPVINVTEQVQVIATIDILDNIVLGSTPLTSPFFRADLDGNGDPDGQDTPINILNRSQNTPVDGINATRDGILVRRAYARLTALNDQLQFEIGRMPDHWGLGMMINSGDCLDCDFGDVVDRAMVGFKAVGHLFQIGLTLVDGGPSFSPFYDRIGPQFDRARWDDVDQYDIRVQKVDHPDDIAEAVAQGQTVINYGLLTAFRLQNDGLDAEAFDVETFDPTSPLNITADDGTEAFVREDRDGFLYIGDVFVRLFSGNWTFEAEAAAILGSFTDDFLPDGRETDIEMYGAHASLQHAFNKAPRTGATLSLQGGFASGDAGQSGELGRGFGAFDRLNTQRGGDDDKLSAFQFSPDFHVDQLLFRRVIGTVIDAWYVGPQISYFFDENAEGRAGVQYAQTFYKRNVPGDETPLGIEIDTELIFGAPSKTASGGEIFLSTQAAILFPVGAGFSPEITEATGGGSFAWSLQARLFLTF